MNNNQLAHAKKLIKKFWIERPSSLLRKIITELLVDSTLDNLEFVKNIVDKNSIEEESKKLLVFFAIRSGNWEVARSNIKGLLSSRPSRELCFFMADIEDGGI